MSYMVTTPTLRPPIYRSVKRVTYGDNTDTKQQISWSVKRVTYGNNTDTKQQIKWSLKSVTYGNNTDTKAADLPECKMCHIW